MSASFDPGSWLVVEQENCPCSIPHAAVAFNIPNGARAWRRPSRPFPPRGGNFVTRGKITLMRGFLLTSKNNSIRISLTMKGYFGFYFYYFSSGHLCTLPL